jgi:thioredoxin 1
MIASPCPQRSREIPVNISGEKEGDFLTVAIDHAIYVAESSLLMRMCTGALMSGVWKLAVIVMVVAGVAGALVLKPSDGEPGWTSRSEIPFDPAAPVPIEPIPPTYESTHPGLPRLVAIGAGSCIPCRAMAPIRADLRRDYAGALVVDFYDVWKDRQAGFHFGIQVIPTLIYYDGAGVELGRQEGYVPKDHILATLRRYGVALPARS